MCSSDLRISLFLRPGYPSFHAPDIPLFTPRISLFSRPGYPSFHAPDIPLFTPRISLFSPPGYPSFHTRSMRMRKSGAGKACASSSTRTCDICYTPICVTCLVNPDSNKVNVPLLSSLQYSLFISLRFSLVLSVYVSPLFFFPFFFQFRKLILVPFDITLSSL